MSQNTSQAAAATDMLIPKTITDFTIAELVSHLSEKIPTNEYNLPIGFYRADLLPLDSTIDYTANPYNDGQQPLRSILSNAFIRLSYQEGFPTLVDGRPFWSQLDFELPEAYKAFELYLQQSSMALIHAYDEDTSTEKNAPGAVGARQLSLIPEMLDRYYGMSSPSKNIEAQGDLLSEITQYFHIYQWGPRARAHDLFQTASLRRQRDLRALSTEDYHYRLSHKLSTKLEKYMEDEEDFWDLMTPKVAIDLLKTVTTLQRLSVGLTTSATSAKDQAERGSRSSLSVMLRQISQADQSGEDIVIDGDTSVILQEAMNDPETARMAQELVIKLSQSG